MRGPDFMRVTIFVAPVERMILLSAQDAPEIQNLSPDAVAKWTRLHP
jgi:hypothetical protein